MEFFNQYSVAWLIGLALALLATGLVAGVLAGLLGVGGIVIVPVLYQLFTLLGIVQTRRSFSGRGAARAVGHIAHWRSHWWCFYPHGYRRRYLERGQPGCEGDDAVDAWLFGQRLRASNIKRLHKNEIHSWPM